MNLVSLATVALLAQTPTTSTEERAAAAAEKAAGAADMAAKAAERAAAAAESLAKLAPGAPAAEAKAGDKPADAPSPWSGSAGVGLTYLSGNSNSVTFAGNGAVTRKSEKWILGAKLWGAYGETTGATGVSDVVALNAGLSAQVDYRFIPRVSGFLAGAIDTDHMKSVELRGSGDLGVGVIFLDIIEADFQKVLLKADLSFRAQHESRYQYYPSSSAGYLAPATLLAPRAAVLFKYALTKGTTFQQDVEFMPNVLGAPRFLLNANSKLTVKILSFVAIGASFGLKWDTAPAPGRVPLDTATQATVEAVF